MNTVDSQASSLLSNISRSLRGGSGGGGGGGGYSGGGYSGGAYHGSSGGTGGGRTSWAIFLLLVGATTAGLILCCFLAKKSNERKAEKFEETVSNARELTKRKSREITSKDGKWTPSDGSYAMSYVDRGRTYSGSATLTFADEGDGYSISGSIRDEDGSSNIVEGFAAYDGTAYWKDRCVRGDIGLSVVSKGKFDIVTSVFTGSWESNTGVSGDYNTFYPLELAQSAP